MNIKNIKLNKKQIIIYSSCLVGIILLIIGLILIFVPKSIEGTQAAKILLARENMNEHDTEFVWNELISQVDTSSEIITTSQNPTFVLADETNASLGTLLHNSEGGKVYKKDGYYNYQNISGASYTGLVVESRIFGIEFEAKNGAKLINYLKNELNIVDRWVKEGYHNYLLVVKDNCEIVFDRYEDDVQDMYDIRILKRTTLENARCVYEMIYTDLTTGKLDNPTYSLYIPGERYEYCYEHDGNGQDYLICEREKGYWNIFMPNENNFSNVIINGNLAHYSSADYESESNYGTIINSTLREDIISVSDNGLNITLSAFNGIKNILVPQEYVIPTKYDGDTKTYYDVDFSARDKIVFDLENGKTLKINDTFIYDSKKVKLTYIDFQFHTNPGFADVQYDVKIFLDIENTSMKEKFTILEKLFNDLGLTCEYNYQDIYESIIKNTEIFNTIQTYYTWQGYLINSTENMQKATQNLHNTWNNLFDSYTQIKDNEIVSNFNKGKIKNNVDFAQINSFTLDSATYLNKQIKISNAKLTINNSQLLEENLNYKLKIGLTKVDSNGNFISQNTVELKTLSTVNSTSFNGNSLTVNASADYDIPLILDEGKYVVVAYVATSEDGIRVSKMHAIAFVDTQNETIETTAMKIDISQNQDKTLNVNYSTKLKFEITLQTNNSYTYEELRRAFMTTILSYGYPLFDSNIQTSDGVNINESDTININTTYKLKFKIPTDLGNVDAYVYCTVLSID